MSQCVAHARQCVGALFLASLLTSCGARSTSKESAAANELPLPSREAAAKVAALPRPYNRGSVENGRTLFGDCAQCHSLELNGDEAKGPNLHGVFGRRAAANESYPYSDALRDSNIVWDARHLDHWIFDPHEALPGTTMAFVGVRNDAKRRDILAYLIAASGDAESDK
jgi:cytochrome c